MLSAFNLQTHAKTYDSLAENFTKKEPLSSQPNIPLHLEKYPHDIVIIPPKSTLKKTTHNPNAKAAQHYSIVEDLSEAPCAISALEVLQTCPVQHKALLLVIRCPTESNLITFDIEHSAPRLSHQLAFQISFTIIAKNRSSNGSR